MTGEFQHCLMNWTIRKTTLPGILPLRSLFLQENNFQIRYDARHQRGWTDSYLISVNEQPIGYGSVAGKNDHHDRDSLFEFYVLPPYRSSASLIFSELIALSAITDITCQTNDLLLSSMAYAFARNIRAEAWLFSDHHTTTLQPAGITFRKRMDGEVMAGYTMDQMGGYVAVKEREVIGTGDFYLHYNPPFADLWMEVMAPHRRKGTGSFLLQELKRACYLAGRVPAARCNLDNAASKACLEKAGFRVCGSMISGDV